MLLPELVLLGRRWRPLGAAAVLFRSPTHLGTRTAEQRRCGSVPSTEPGRKMAGLDLTVTFGQTDREAAFDDHSEIYRCEISTEHSPAALAVGSTRRRAEGGIDIALFHHTTQRSPRPHPRVRSRARVGMELPGDAGARERGVRLFHEYESSYK